MCDFSLVDGYDHDEEADPDPGDCSTRVQPVDILGSSLEASAHDKDERSHEDGPSSSEVVAPGTGECSTEEGASSEQRYGSSAME